MLVDLTTGITTQLSTTADHEGHPVVGGNYVVFERGPVPLGMG